MASHFKKVSLLHILGVSNMRILVILLLFYPLIVISNSIDELSLLAIKSGISKDPEGVLASWNQSVHFCQWRGITCDLKHKRVTSLDLSSSGLEGTLSPFIGNLSNIRNISFSNNTLHGNIPPQVGYLSNLQTFNLTYNSFDGEIPANLSRCTNLLMLVLNNNNLNGRIPKQLGFLPRLQIISIHKNQLEGDLNTLGNITSLEVISAAENMFEGSIPDSFGNLKQLTHLYLGTTNISGTIPLSFYNLSSLIELSISFNQLQGGLLPELGLQFPKLEILQINQNLFSGPLPWSLTNLSNIKIIEMGSNEFTGKIEIDGRRLPELQYLNLAGNYLGLGVGEEDGLNFIETLVNCSSLRVLTVASNQLGGTLPRSTANLSTSLHYLHVGWNNISGEIPPGLGNLRNLIQLIFQFNLLTGIVPRDIGEIQSLETLSLTGNRFHGNIPTSFGNLTKLSGLYLNGNFFEGAIPSSLGSCKNLNGLALDVNNLSGKIPGELFNARSISRILYLSNNELEGSLPAEVGQLQNLVLLDISYNKLSGELPESLGSCTSMMNLYLENNLFHGPIPPSLSNLKGIQVIDLSQNNLTGLIPKYFSDFQLISLNLSFNNFEGSVPIDGIFSNATAVSLAGNSKLCGGIAALHFPNCTTKPVRKKTSHKLVLTIGILCPLVALVLIALLSALIYRKGRRKHPESISPPSKDSFLRVSYNMLHKATDGFSSKYLIGSGSFGSVYQGILEPDQTPVAIKVLDLQHQAAMKSFIAECNVLQNIRHRNLLRIITVCSSADFQGHDFKALVYDFMPNGSLENWLHSGPMRVDEPKEHQNLGLSQRINIAIDVAVAVDYLHHGSQIAVIHCDLKPSNILLDHDMTAHVGDFGLARLLPYMPRPTESSSNTIRGTIGYAAPEYGQGSDPSKGGDIYSFGILLLEMMTGKRPTDQIFQEGLTLHNYAKAFTSETVLEMMDPRLAEDYDYDETYSSKLMECLTSLVQVGVKCSEEIPNDRMNLHEAIRELQSARKVLKISNSRVMDTK